MKIIHSIRITHAKLKYPGQTKMYWEWQTIPEGIKTESIITKDVGVLKKSFENVFLVEL